MPVSMMDKAQLSFSLALPRDHSIPLKKPCVMGVINVSPDSFYRPISKLTDALRAAEQMVAQGASIIDIGGVATNPFVDLDKKPSVQQQIDRVIPIIDAIKKNVDVLISIDTSQPNVMQEAVNHGAHMINDQSALRVPGALETVAKLQVPVCLMHGFKLKRHPASTDYPELLLQIKRELVETVKRCIQAGIQKDRIILDPGFGQGHYGKNADENYYLLANLEEFVSIGYPLLIGWSRKSMIGDALGGVPAEQRLYGSIAAATIGGLLGAAIIRVHDVGETMDAITICRRVITMRDKKE